MRTLTHSLLTSLIFAVVCFTTSFAQNKSEYISHLRIVEVQPFNKVELNLNTDVIFKKSSKNRITLAGDSSFIAGIPVNSEGNTLSLNYNNEPDNKLYQVVIEYTQIDTASTKGNGMYYFDKMDQERLDIFNPQAKVILKGKATHIRIISQNGLNDVSDLVVDKMVLRLGESATLVDRNDAILSALEWR